MIRVGSSLGISRWVVIAGAVWAALLATTLVLERWTGVAAHTCLFKQVTGCPCPTCGSTRAALSLAHGDMFDALAWNPLMVMVVCAALVALARLGIGSLRSRDATPRASWSQAQISCLAIGIAAATCANWAYVIWHGN